MDRIKVWMDGLYDFLFILSITVFGFTVQIGTMYIKDKILKRSKVFVLFIVSLSISFAINKVMKKFGYDEWIWIAIWVYNANSFWISDSVIKKVRGAVEKAVPSIVTAWADKIKPKDNLKNDDDSTLS